MASKIIVDQIESSGSNITIPTGTGLVVTDGIAATNLSGTISDARLPTIPEAKLPTIPEAKLPTIPVSKGGTGLTSLGSAGQVVQVNSGANALEFAAASSGKVKQVQYGMVSAVQSSTSSSFAVITGCTLNITPNHANNLIIIHACVGEPDDVTGRLAVHIHKDGVAENAHGRLVSEMGRNLSNTGNETHRSGTGIVFVDVAGGTNQITYDLRMRSVTGSTVRIGNGGSTNIMAMEIEV